ncbi:hypothetical protein AAG570_009582 [Ranatra chinensis]|uniref:Fibronectin type-III domain-containing protein n=1 Tax=Ranatra chinensis TaxID=642074 RepID=A0ABD0YQ36_9HEMI
MTEYLACDEFVSRRFLRGRCWIACPLTSGWSRQPLRYPNLFRHLVIESSIILYMLRALFGVGYWIWIKRLDVYWFARVGIGEPSALYNRNMAVVLRCTDHKKHSLVMDWQQGGTQEEPQSTLYTLQMKDNTGHWITKFFLLTSGSDRRAEVMGLGPEEVYTFRLGTNGMRDGPQETHWTQPVTGATAGK